MSSTTSPRIDSEGVLHNQDTWIDRLQSSENCAKLEDAIRRADVSHDVRRLNATIEEMKNDFRKLSLDFATHDRELKAIEACRPEDGLKPLKPRWDKLRDRFTLLLDQSHTNATEASSVLKRRTKWSRCTPHELKALLEYINLFTDGTVSDSRNFEPLRKEVDNLLTIVNGRILSAQGTENNFASLAGDMREFETHVRSAVLMVNRHSKSMHKDLAETSEKVRSLRCQLTKASEELVDLGITVLGHLSTGAISAGMLFLKLSPDTVQSVLTSLLSAFSPARAASSKLVKTMKLKKAVREGERTLAALQRKYGAIKFLEESLVHAAVNVDGLAARIDGIANIWYLIKADMYDIRVELCNILDGTPQQQLFVQKLRVTRGVYRRLIETLDIYSRGVTS